MKIYFTLILSLLFTCSSNAQKEDYIWFLGIDQSPDEGVQAMMIDWNVKNAPPVQKDLAFGINKNNASICDAEGNLLFWSNGCAVINREQEVMPNGDTLNWDAFREVIGWAECTRGYPGTQNIKILPDPGDENGFYIFHKAWKYNGQFEDITYELRYSYVDMTLDDGMGDVVYFDSVLFDGRTTLSNLEAVYTDDKKGWWVLQPEEEASVILTYQVNENGIERYPDQEAGVFFPKVRSGGGTMRISPDGTKLAYYEYFLNLHIYDFDRRTGKVSNHQKVTIFEDSENMPDDKFRFGSVEWSPNSRFMYVAIRDSLFQVDGWEANLDDAIRLIDVYDGTLNPFVTTFYVSTLAPDCKIYICSGNGNRSYHVINQPNELGTACDFVQNGLQLPQYAGSADLPLFPRFRVDEAEKCDPTITSVFGNLVYYRRDLKVYPNPAQTLITIDLPEEGLGDSDLVIYNLKGELIKRQKINAYYSNWEEDIRDLASGVYHLEIYPQKNPERIFYGAQIVKME